MSSPSDDGFDVAGVRDVGADQAYHAGEIAAPARDDVPAARPDAPAEAVKISLSPEAKAAIEVIERARNAENAKRGAKEIAAVAGVSESQAVQAAQPQRSPPPAKGAALFQANLAADAKKE